MAVKVPIINRLGLTLTTPELLAAVAQLEGATLPARTLASWAAKGLVLPSVRWDRRRGRYSPRIYSLADVALVRLIVRLRSRGVSMPQVQAMLAYLGAELREVLKPGTRAALVVDGQRVYIQRPGAADVEVPTGQLRLRLDSVLVGNMKAAREARAAA